MEVLLFGYQGREALLVCHQLFLCLVEYLGEDLRLVKVVSDGSLVIFKLVSVILYDGDVYLHTVSQLVFVCSLQVSVCQIEIEVYIGHIIHWNEMAGLTGGEPYSQ